MERLRLAELLAGLSLLADAGMGAEPGDAGRAALVAGGAGRGGRVGRARRRLLHRAAPARRLHGFAHEAAALLGGDEIAVKRAALRTDFGDVRQIARGYLLHLAPAAPPLTRARAAGTAVVRARAIVAGYSRANCEVAARTAERVGLGAGRRGRAARRLRALGRRRRPARDGAASDRASRPGSRRSPGPPRCSTGSAARRRPSRRSAGAPGPVLDPELAALVRRQARQVLAVLDAADPLAAAVAAEPAPAVLVSDAGLDRVCRAFGEAVDLKTPLHHGHATGVAELAAAAGERAGLGAATAAALRRAGLRARHRARRPCRTASGSGPGRCPGRSRSASGCTPTTPSGSSRAAARSPRSPRWPGCTTSGSTARATTAAATAAATPPAARVLAAADAFQAMTQARAHRPARSPARRGEILAGEARGGRLDPDAVRAVLGRRGPAAAAGRASARPASPSGRSRCSGSSRAGSRTRRSPGAS